MSILCGCDDSLPDAEQSAKSITPQSTNVVRPTCQCRSDLPPLLCVDTRNQKLTRLAFYRYVNNWQQLYKYWERTVRYRLRVRKFAIFFCSLCITIHHPLQGIKLTPLSVPSAARWLCCLDTHTYPGPALANFSMNSLRCRWCRKPTAHCNKSRDAVDLLEKLRPAL